MTDEEKRARAVAAVRQFAAERIAKRGGRPARKIDWNTMRKLSNAEGKQAEVYDPSAFVPDVDGLPAALGDDFYTTARVGRPVVPLSAILSDFGPAHVVEDLLGGGVRIVDDLLNTDEEND